MESAGLLEGAVAMVRHESVPGDLVASYAFCRDLHRTHGRTYYLATRLLPAWKRPYVHALYGFTRYTDDLVDRVDGTDPVRRAGGPPRWAGRVPARPDGRAPSRGAASTCH